MSRIRQIVRKYCPAFCLTVYRKSKLKAARKLWRENNKHNGTVLKSYTDISLIDVGNYTYGDLDVIASQGIDDKLRIGHFCSIASDVKFFLTGNHEMKTVSTFPFGVRLFGELPVGLGNGSIIVGDDVWIGQRAMIMSGVTIGQGAVVGAGAVVTKNIPPYAIVGGVPAKIIRYRFDDDVIQELLKLEYGKLDINTIQHIRETLEEDITIYNVKKIVNTINNNR